MRLGSSLVESSFFQDVECSNLIDQLVMYTEHTCNVYFPILHIFAWIWKYNNNCIIIYSSFYKTITILEKLFGGNGTKEQFRNIMITEINLHDIKLKLNINS